MMKKRRGLTALAVLSAVGLMLWAGCDEGGTGGPSGPAIPTATQLVGTWRIVQVDEAWSETEDGATYNFSESDTIRDTSEVYSISPTLMIWAWFLSGDTCYDDSYQGGYTLGADGTLNGLTWSGTEVYDGCTYSWVTKVEIAGGQLIVTATYLEECTDGYRYAESYVEYCEPLAGGFPPAGWPLDACPTLPKSRAHVSKGRTR
jgi:hypothetical protein